MSITCRKPLELTWHIQNFRSRIAVLGEGIESLRFESESLGPISWCLVLYLGGYEDSNYVACFLKHCGGHRNRGAVVDLDIHLIAGKGPEAFLKTASNLMFENGYSLGFPKFASRKEILRCSYPSKTLTLRCCISSSNDTKYVEDFIPLSNDIKLLHDEKTFYDVIIRVGEKEFKIHKSLLIARIPGLVKYIECSHLEESIPFVVISGFTPQVVTEVLYFIYTGKFTKKCDSFYYQVKLKEFASKYDMVNLLNKLKWDIGECTLNTNLMTMTTDHLLDLSKSLYLGLTTSSTLPLIFAQTRSTKINVQYLTSSDLQGMTINVGLSIETNSECKYNLQAKLKGSLVCNNNMAVPCHEHSIHVNNFDSGTKEKSGIVLKSDYFSFFVQRDTLLKYRFKDNLQQKCMIMYEWEASFSPSSIKTSPTSLDTLTYFSEDMYELFLHGIDTDMVLVTVSDGIEFNVHKCVVCARVPSIMAMFKGDAFAVNGYVHDDLKNVRVEIPDIDSNTFRAILKYIYSGKIEEAEINQALELFPKLVPIYMKQLRKGNGERRIQ